VLAVSNTQAPRGGRTYENVCHSHVSEADKEIRYRLDPRGWFTGARFEQIDVLEVAETREVPIADLVGRALSKSNTSPANLGDRRSAFEAEITAALEPFAHRGVLQEQIVARATIFARSVRPLLDRRSRHVGPWADYMRNR
jgi:hypothetical protein